MKCLINLWKKIEFFSAQIFGVAGYEMYVKHLQEKHPDVKPITLVEFFKLKESHRYQNKGKCC